MGDTFKDDTQKYIMKPHKDELRKSLYAFYNLLNSKIAKNTMIYVIFMHFNLPKKAFPQPAFP